MQHENELKDFISWQEKINELARRFCPDENDRALLDVETYDVHSKWDCGQMTAQGEYGDYVEVESFRKLAERFLLAMELIRLFEEDKSCDNCGNSQSACYDCSRYRNDLWLPAAPKKE